MTDFLVLLISRVFVRPVKGEIKTWLAMRIRYRLDIESSALDRA